MLASNPLSLDWHRIMSEDINRPSVKVPWLEPIWLKGFQKRDLDTSGLVPFPGTWLT